MLIRNCLALNLIQFFIGNFFSTKMVQGAYSNTAFNSKDLFDLFSTVQYHCSQSLMNDCFVKSYQCRFKIC